MDDQRIILASGDGHVGAPAEVYGDYLEKRLRPAFQEFMQERVPRWASLKETSWWPTTLRSWFEDTEGFDPENGTAVAWDPNMRLKALDHCGVAAEVFFPDDQSNNDPPWASGLATNPHNTIEGYPPELIRAGARAYNRWLADFCSADPKRLLGLTVLGTLDDVVWCCDEIERAYESGLTTGVMLALEYYLPHYHHRRYEILWETCCELDLPVNVHVGRGLPNFLGDDPRTHMGVMMAEGMGYTLRPVASLIMGGVLERYPDLRMVIVEAGVGWVPQFVGSLDAAFETWEGMQASATPMTDRPVHLSMKPSEYFQRQVFVTHSISQRREEFEDEALAMVPNPVFGADIGHMEGWWPFFGAPKGSLPDPVPPFYQFLTPLEEATPTREAYKAVWGGMKAEKLMPYLQDNFFRLFANIDREALRAVADEVCPTPAEMGLV
jgi:predicted TIM-barrel fold metal-dependent hydrolase